MATETETEAEKKAAAAAAKIEEMKRCKTKLLLWYTHDFRPLFTHKELEPIMETLGFLPLPIPQNSKISNVAIVWKEYQYGGSAAITTRIGAYRSRSEVTVKTPLPKPRLPYPRIDGLHLFTYKAFMDAVNFYLRRRYFGDVFHIWALPIHPIYDKRLSWDFMSKNHTDVVYRLGTLDNGLFHLYSVDDLDYVAGKRFETKDDDDNHTITMVSMEDIIVTEHQKNYSSSSQDHEATESMQ